VSGEEAANLAEPVRVVSDLHLAHPSCVIGGIRELQPLVHGAATVVFNGDTIEASSAAWKPRGLERLEELKDLCAAEGSRPVCLPGNHDPDISDRGWVRLAGEAILVTHGHMIYEAGAPWSYEYLERKQRVREILAGAHDSGHDLGKRHQSAQRIARALAPGCLRRMSRRKRFYVLSALWPPERLFNIARVWCTHVREARGLVERFAPETRVLLYGHFHRSGVWRRNGRWFCNTGAFMPGIAPLVAEWAEARLVVRRVERSPAGFSPGRLVASIIPES